MPPTGRLHDLAQYGLFGPVFLKRYNESCDLIPNQHCNAASDARRDDCHKQHRAFRQLWRHCHGYLQSGIVVLLGATPIDQSADADAAVEPVLAPQFDHRLRTKDFRTRGAGERHFCAGGRPAQRAAGPGRGRSRPQRMPKTTPWRISSRRCPHPQRAPRLRLGATAASSSWSRAPVGSCSRHAITARAPIQCTVIYVSLQRLKKKPKTGESRDTRDRGIHISHAATGHRVPECPGGVGLHHRVPYRESYAGARHLQRWAFA